jgi:hypothetical protein
MITLTNYELRVSDTAKAKPEDRGRKVAEFETFREAFREAQRRHERGELSVSIHKVTTTY